PPCCFKLIYWLRKFTIGKRVQDLPCGIMPFSKHLVYSKNLAPLIFGIYVVANIDGLLKKEVLTWKMTAW
ncbi:MAG: hypothetical protein FWG66_00905, partial [Spirochaetes bacterium]|nr:hypothetical protein [Spirochaetota bacterium]